MTRALSPTSVIQNFFQEPFLRTPRSVVGKRDGAAVLSSAATGDAARWVLKQVQDDEEERVAV
jgi:hypothetical protein